jgi:hypothetical protein
MGVSSDRWVQHLDRATVAGVVAGTNDDVAAPAGRAARKARRRALLETPAHPV